MALEQLFAPKNVQQRRAKPVVARDVRDLHEYLDVTPKQFSAIKDLRAEYYKYMDVIVSHYSAMPAALWLLRSLIELEDGVPTTLERLTDQLLEWDNQELVPDNEKKLSKMRRAMSLPEKDEWMDTIDAIDALLHMNIKGSLGTYRSRYYQPTPVALENVVKNFSVAAYDSLEAHKHALLAPVHEWDLIKACDFSAKKSQRTEDVDERNARQLSERAYTIQGMQEIVDDARKEARQYRDKLMEVYVKIVQFIELIESAVEDGRLDKSVLDVVKACATYAAPMIS